MTWSILPKMVSPFSSNISISIRSPNFMNSVVGLPSAIVSRHLISEIQDDPSLLPTLDTVPDPTTVPAMSGRDLARGKSAAAGSKVLSTPALGEPSFTPFMVECNGRWIFPPVPGIAQFIRRDGDGCKRGMGLGLVKPELLGQFLGDQVPERYVVDDGDELDMGLCLFRSDACGHVVGKDRHL